MQNYIFEKKAMISKKKIKKMKKYVLIDLYQVNNSGC